MIELRGRRAAVEPTNQRYASYAKLVRTWFWGNNTVQPLYRRVYFHIGNRVLMSVPLAEVKRRGSGGIVFHTMLSLAHGQVEAGLRRIYCKGVLTLGPVLEHSHGLVGAGISKAERFIADLTHYPRIIVDPALLAAIEREPLLRHSEHDAEEEMLAIRQLVRQADDGLWFIDYLAATEGEAETDEEYREMLAMHKRRLERQSGMAQEIDSSAAELAWLVTYHDRTVRRYARRVGLSPEERDGLLVEAELPVRFRF